MIVRNLPAIIDSVDHNITFTLHSQADLSNLQLKYNLPDGIIISPDPSILSDYTLPVKFNLTNINQKLSTEWTIFAFVDKAPVITDLHYDEKSPASIIVTFNEPIHIEDSLTKVEDVPFVRIYESGDVENKISFEKVYESENKVLKIQLENSLKPGTKYTVFIDSVFDLYYNKMPAYEWTFITDGSNEINNSNDISGFNIWPNPAFGEMYIKLPSKFTSSNITIKLVSAEGRVFIPYVEENGLIKRLLITNIRSGLYILYIKNDMEVLSALVYVK